MTILPFVLLGIVATSIQGTSDWNRTKTVANLEIEDERLTKEQFIRAANWFIAYKQYVPSFIVAELEDIMKPENSAEIDELIEVSSDQYEITSTIENGAIDSRHEKESPKLYARGARLMEAAKLRYFGISEEARQFFTEISRDFKTSKSKTTYDRIRLFAGVKKSFENLPLHCQLEYEVQFPEIMKFLRTPPFQKFINTFVELSEQSDEEIDEGMGSAALVLVTEFMMMEHSSDTITLSSSINQ